MASVKDFYKRKLLAAKDLGSKAIVGVISDVYPETQKGKDADGSTKLIVEIDDGNTRIQLNKTNALQLAKELGDDFDSWKGIKVKVTTIDTVYNGNKCKGLAVHKAGK